MQIYPDVRNNDVEISDIEHETLDAISTLSFKFVYFWHNIQISVI